MSSRMQGITPFNSSSSSASQREKSAPKVKISNDVSTHKKPAADDSLYRALKHAEIHADNRHSFTKRAVKPSGMHYKPDQEFGGLKRQGKGKGVYTYGKAPGGKGENPLGSPAGRGRAANALGSYSGKHGSNAIGNPPNRSGSNANFKPNPNNKMGGNALSKALVSRGSFRGKP